MVRSYPNIVVTGTPGTGKTTLAAQICEMFTGPSGAHVMRHMDVGPLVKQQGFHKSYDADWETYEVDEDQLIDHLEPLSGGSAPEPLDVDPSACEDAKEIADDDETRGGLVLDWHTCDAWPERWVDLVIVLRCDHQLLWKRLEKRNYAEKKIAENNEAEIMGVVAEDAQESYAPECIVTLRSESADEMESNAERIVQWIHAWRQQRGLEA
ncbi:adenylate kinase [Malassezia japonica]|uniref:Adenylate kinase isoenzyme 6 homolog n=1 Tax=Malassezia japonica TaxID=223818 RepID=A0AAF0EZ57_9BASI|nr:adenylate kinase [Malassezia japonica]WFD37457.1 adenylate kinase [Malassezia japonica]